MFRSLLVVVLVAVVYVVAADVKLYEDKYDYINADEILANDRLREQYRKCFMEIEPCHTPDAKFFKGHFAEAIATQCQMCTDKQKMFLEKVTEWYTTNEPKHWEEILLKYIGEAKAMKKAAKA